MGSKREAMKNSCNKREGEERLTRRAGKREREKEKEALSV